METLILDGLVDDVMKLGLYEVGTKVQYKHYGITPNGNKDWITSIGMVAARGPELCGWWHDYLLYFEDKSVGWEMNTSNSIIHNVKENTFNAFRGFPGTFVWATQAQVERIEEDMVTINDIKEASIKLKDMVDEFKKNYEGNSNGFRFKEGDLVVVVHRLGDVAGCVVSCNARYDNEGRYNSYIVFLPNDFRGKELSNLPEAVLCKFSTYKFRRGTFIYANERDLRGLYPVRGDK